MKRLNIFIDETGGFGFGKGTSRLYGISFVFHEQGNDISKEINTLNTRLNKLGYYNMIHTAALVINKDEYKVLVPTSEKVSLMPYIHFLKELMSNTIQLSLIKNI